MINYSNVLRIKIKSVYVKVFLISTKVRLKRVEHLHGEEPISSEPTFNSNLKLYQNKRAFCNSQQPMNNFLITITKSYTFIVCNTGNRITIKFTTLLFENMHPQL